MIFFFKTSWLILSRILNLVFALSTVVVGFLSGASWFSCRETGLVAKPRTIPAFPLWPGDPPWAPVLLHTEDEWSWWICLCTISESFWDFFFLFGICGFITVHVSIVYGFRIICTNDVIMICIKWIQFGLCCCPNPRLIIWYKLQTNAAALLKMQWLLVFFQGFLAV